MGSKKKRGKKSGGKDGAKATPPSQSSSPSLPRAENAEAEEGASVPLFAEPRDMAALRAYFTLQGGAEWWWLQDQTIAAVAKHLRSRHFVCLDSFIPDDQAKELLADVKSLEATGSAFSSGHLAGNSLGGGLTYVHKYVRGDQVCWMNGEEPHWSSASSSKLGGKHNTLGFYLKKMDTFLSELGGLPEMKAELGGVKDRSHAMITYYPGTGAHYVRHCDNHCNEGDGDACNGRRITAILYLNDGWKASDGGELLLYHPPPNHNTPQTRVAPRLGSVIMFYADYRVPHAVLPSFNDRFAITTWYYDAEERRLAVERGTASQDAEDRAARQEERVRKEIQEFESRFGAPADQEFFRKVEGDAGSGADGCGSVEKGEDMQGRGAEGVTQPEADGGPIDAAGGDVSGSYPDYKEVGERAVTTSSSPTAKKQVDGCAVAALSNPERTKQEPLRAPTPPQFLPAEGPTAESIHPPQNERELAIVPEPAPAPVLLEDREAGLTLVKQQDGRTEFVFT